MARLRWYSNDMPRRDDDYVGVSLAPDPVIEAYKKDVDRTLIRENLKLTPDERLRRLEAFIRDMVALRVAVQQRR
jgi:hypothetical protein